MQVYSSSTCCCTVCTVFDPEDRGYITRADLKFIMMNRGEKMTDEEAEEMVNEFDKDGDGKIEYAGE